jgi:hypothetical protein
MNHAPVAQVSNLLYRRLPAGRPWKNRRDRKLAALADWKSAIQQTGSLRYGGSFAVTEKN